MPTPRASVVVCTYNRAGRLVFCLDSLAAQTIPSGDFEIIVVDDGSTDDTPQVCARFAHLSNLRIIRQPNTGLGAARERGWRASSAPIIAFLDDDAEAPPGWLASALARFTANATRQNPPAVLGGPTRGRWETPRPGWLDDRLAAWLTVWEPFEAYRESSEGHLFVGANMFFLRSALEQAGGFDTRLGRRGATLLSHEESELWARLSRAGHLAAHDPDIWVWHYVPAIHIRLSWFRRRIYWEGVSMIRRDRPPGDRPRLWRAARHVLQALLTPPAHFGGARAWQFNLAYNLGRARELLRVAKP